MFLSLRFINKTGRRYLSSSTYNIISKTIGDRKENIMLGYQHNFSLLNKGFEGIKQIGIIGWGSQGPSQALNIYDSLKCAQSDIKIRIGLRKDSKSIQKVLDTGVFKKEDIGEIKEVLNESDMNLILISDKAQVENYRMIFDNIKPGSTLGFSHGFLQGHLENVNDKFPDDVNVVMMAPKGMGPSLRKQYLLGGGINSSVAVENDVNNKASDYALSWALAVGSPTIFETTFRSEYISDLFGERAILLGGIYGMVEYLFGEYSKIYNIEKSFLSSVGSMTGPISDYISNHGFLQLYNNMSPGDKSQFMRYYLKSYEISKEVFNEIYREVESRNEIRSVILNSDYNIGRIDKSRMWVIGKKIYNNRERINDELKNFNSTKCNKNNENTKEFDKNLTSNIYPQTAGMYVGAMMAQINILLDNGHSYSEIVNESIIEATDSLNPYLNDKGISHMIDNCSTTARLGARKWAPRLEYAYRQNMDFTLCNNDFNSKEFDSFLNHKIHKIINDIYEFKVD